MSTPDIINVARGLASMLASVVQPKLAQSELRFEGQGVDVVRPGVIVMLSPPAKLPPVPSLLMFPWEITVFAVPDSAATVAEEAAAAMHMLAVIDRAIRFSDYHALQLSADEPVSFVSMVPNNVICALNYEYLAPLD